MDDLSRELCNWNVYIWLFNTIKDLRLLSFLHISERKLGSFVLYNFHWWYMLLIIIVYNVIPSFISSQSQWMDFPYQLIKVPCSSNHLTQKGETTFKFLWLDRLLISTCNTPWEKMCFYKTDYLIQYCFWAPVYLFGFLVYHSILK